MSYEVIPLNLFCHYYHCFIYLFNFVILFIYKCYLSFIESDQYVGPQPLICFVGDPLLVNMFLLLCS